MPWLMICLALLAYAWGATASLAAALSETYEIRIAGIISTPERTQLQGTLAPIHPTLSLTNSVNQCSPASQAPLTFKDEIIGIIKSTTDAQSPEISLGRLNVGDCYKNFCFLGLSHNKKSVEVSIFQNGEWVYATISPGSSYSLKMDSISGYQSSLKTLLEKQKKFFPELKMIGDETMRLIDGKWTSESILHSQPDQISSYSEFLDKLDELQVTVTDGISYFGPPTTSCSKAVGNFLPAMTAAMARLCVMSDGHSIGYCIGHGICTEISNLRPANECGGLIAPGKSNKIFPDPEAFPLIMSELEEIRAKAHNGRSCIASAIPLLISSVWQEMDGPSRRNDFYNLKTGFDTHGYCLNGKCTPKEINQCTNSDRSLVIEISSTDLQAILGDDIARAFNTLHPPQPGSSAYNRMENYFGKLENRKKHLRSQPPRQDGSSCPGGMCQNGNCVPFEDLISSESKNGFCANRVNGHSCPTDESSSGKGLLNGNCYQGACLLCQHSKDGTESMPAAPDCPAHPDYKGIRGIRKSCRDPDICSYRR